MSFLDLHVDAQVDIVLALLTPEFSRKEAKKVALSVLNLLCVSKGMRQLMERRVPRVAYHDFFRKYTFLRNFAVNNRIVFQGIEFVSIQDIVHSALVELTESCMYCGVRCSNIFPGLMKRMCVFCYRTFTIHDTQLLRDGWKYDQVQRLPIFIPCHYSTHTTISYGSAHQVVFTSHRRVFLREDVERVRDWVRVMDIKIS